MSRPNVRVRRTRTLLREALVALIEERGFDRITVGELTGRAMISRAAFYRNYRDKYELVEQIFDEAMAELTSDADTTRSPNRRWADFLRHVGDYHRLYGALLGNKGSPWFTDRMRTALATMSTAHLPDQTPTDLTPTIISAMFVQSIVWWLDHNRPCSPEQLAEHSAHLVRAVLTASQ